jgi:NADH-quinone oxidoreductase subunit L
VGAGYINMPVHKLYWFEHQTESSIGLPIAHAEEEGAEGEGHAEEEAAAVEGEHATEGEAAAAEEEGHSEAIYSVPAPPKFKWANAAPGLLLVALGFVISLGLSMAVFGRRKNPFSVFVGLTTKNRVVHRAHWVLVNKYGLDSLYENVIVRAVAHPIAKAAYWVNQNIIDGIVNGAGKAGKQTGEMVYRYIDQGLVDRAVNASGTVASESGHAAQTMQSGKVNQYGALLFGAAAVGAIVLILINA